MDFRGAGLEKYMSGILGIDAGSAQDCYPAGGCLDELPEEGDSCLSGGLLSGGEDAVAAEVDNLLECRERVATYIECAVEGDAWRVVWRTLPCTSYHTGCLVEVYVALVGEGAYDYAVGSVPDGRSYVGKGLSVLHGGIDETALTGAYEDVDLDGGGTTDGYGLAYSICRGGEAVMFEVAAELDTVGACLYGGADAGYIGATDFEYHIIVCIVLRLHGRSSRCRRDAGRRGRWHRYGGKRRER